MHRDRIYHRSNGFTFRNQKESRIEINEIMLNWERAKNKYNDANSIKFLKVSGKRILFKVRSRNFSLTVRSIQWDLVWSFEWNVNYIVKCGRGMMWDDDEPNIIKLNIVLVSSMCDRSRQSQWDHFGWK